MKRVLILNGANTDLSNFSVRFVLESFGYIVTTYYMGRPQDYFDIFGEKEKFDYDYLIIGCHGEGGRIIPPVLGDDIYYPDECRGNIGFEELHNKVKINNKTIICTGCTTGSGDLYRAFTSNGNTFIAPTDYIEGKSDLMFVINLFYHLSNNKTLADSFALATETDKETGLYRLYSKGL